MKIFNIFKRKSTSIGAIYPVELPDAVWTTQDYENLAKAGYQQSPVVKACVDLISEAVGEIPWKLFKRKEGKDAQSEEIENHVILERLRKPNEDQSEQQFKEEIMKNYLLAGNSYTLKIGPETGDNRGIPLYLVNLKPHRMKVIQNKTNPATPVAGYKYQVTGRDPQVFKAEDVLHIKDYHPTNDWYGLSRLEVVARSVDISNMIDEWHNKLLQNDCRPPGAWIYKGGTLTDEQRKNLEKIIYEKLSGYKNVGKPLILGGGEWEWIDFGITPRDMDHKDTAIMAMRQICSIFKVPSEVLWDTEQKTYSNYREAIKALYMEAILKHVNMLVDEFNRWLIPAFEEESLYLDYDKNEIEAIQENRAEKFTYLKTADWLKDNEKRIASGYDETPEGDAIYKPISMVPVGEAAPIDDDANALKSMQFKSDSKGSFWTVPERKKALWLNFTTRVKAKEKPYIPIAVKYMEAQARRLKKNMADLTTLDNFRAEAYFDVEDEAKRYQEKFMPWYVDTFTRAGEAGIAASKGELYSLETKEGEWDFELLEQLLEDLKAETLKTGTTVNRTAIDVIYRTLRRAEQNEWTVEEFRKMIAHQLGDEMPKWRSRLWAETEATKIENKGQHEGYKQAEFIERRGWLCMNLPESRDAHIAADIEYSDNPLPLDEPFIVGGEQVMYPGDGSAANACRCKCTTFPAVEKIEGD